MFAFKKLSDFEYMVIFTICGKLIIVDLHQSCPIEKIVQTPPAPAMGGMNFFRVSIMSMKPLQDMHAILDFMSIISEGFQ